MALPCDSGPEKADLQVAVGISRREEIKVAELLPSERCQGTIWAEGLLVHAVTGIVPAEFGLELVAHTERTVPEKGR